MNVVELGTETQKLHINKKKMKKQYALKDI